MSDLIEIEQFGESGKGNDDSDVFNLAFRRIKSGQRITLSHEKTYNINRPLIMPDVSVDFTIGGVEGSYAQVNYTGQNGPMLDFSGSRSGVSNLEIKGDLEDNSISSAAGIKIDCELTYIKRLKLTNLFSGAEFTEDCSDKFNDEITYSGNTFDDFSKGGSARIEASLSTQKSNGNGNIWDGFTAFSSGAVTETRDGNVLTASFDTDVSGGVVRYYMTFSNLAVEAGKEYMFSVTLDEGTTGSFTALPWINWQGAAPTSGVKSFTGANFATDGPGVYAIIFVASATETAAFVRLGFGTSNTVAGAATMVVSSFQFSEIKNGQPVENMLPGNSAAYNTINTSTYNPTTGFVELSTGANISPKIKNTNIVAFTGDSFSSDSNTYPRKWEIQDRTGFAAYIDGVSGRTIIDGAPNIPALIAGNYQFGTTMLRDGIDNTLSAGILSLQGGVNDMRFDNTAADVLAVVDKVISDNKVKGVHTILWTVTPFGNDFLWSQAREDETILYNSEIRNRQSPTVTVFDLFTKMLEPGTVFDFIAIYDLGDGLHPNSAGQDFITAEITTIINFINDSDSFFKLSTPRIVHSENAVKGQTTSSIWDGFVPFLSGNVTDTVVGDVRTVAIDTVTVPGESRYFLTFSNLPVIAGRTYMFRVTLDEGSFGSVSGPWMNWQGAAPTGGQKTLNGIDIAALGAGEYGILFVASTTETSFVRLGFGTGNTVTGVATMVVSSFQFSEAPNGIPVERVFNGQSAAYENENTSTYDSSTGLMTLSTGSKIAPKVSNRNIVAFSGDSFSDETRNYPYQWYIQDRDNFAMYLDGATGRTLINGAPNVPALIAGNLQNSSNMYIKPIQNTLPAGILSFQGGTNDMFALNSVSSMLTVVEQVLIDNEKKGVYTILWTISPFGNAPGWSQEREDIALEYNAAIRAKVRPNVVVYDVFADMLEPATTFNLNPIYDPGDGIHPNDAGIVVLTAAITALIDAAQ